MKGIEARPPLRLVEKDLEMQFSEERALDLGAESLRYTMLDRHRESREAAGGWIIFIGGFASTKETYKQEMLGLARLGKRVLFVSPDKGTAPSEAEDEYFQAHEGFLPETVQRKAAALTRLVSALGITDVQVVGHSIGAAVAVAFTGAHPNMVHRLLLDNPAGCMGEDTLLDLYRRAVREAKSEVLLHRREGTSRVGTDVWKRRLQRVKQELPWRISREIPDIVRINILPVLEELKNEQDGHGAGVEVILVNSNQDMLFPKEAIEKALGEHPFDRYVHRWVMYADPHATHGKLDRPDAELIPQLMKESLSRPSVIQQLLIDDPPESVSSETLRKAA